MKRRSMRTMMKVRIDEGEDEGHTVFMVLMMVVMLLMRGRMLGVGRCGRATKNVHLQHAGFASSLWLLCGFFWFLVGFLWGFCVGLWAEPEKLCKFCVLLYSRLCKFLFV